MLSNNLRKRLLYLHTILSIYRWFCKIIICFNHNEYFLWKLNWNLMHLTVPFLENCQQSKYDVPNKCNIAYLKRQLFFTMVFQTIWFLLYRNHSKYIVWFLRQPLQFNFTNLFRIHKAERRPGEGRLSLWQSLGEVYVKQWTFFGRYIDGEHMLYRSNEMILTKN